MRQQPWATHVATALGYSANEAVQVGGAAALLGHMITDYPGAPGPLGGLLAALKDRAARFGDGLLVLASCDLVEPSSDWIAPLNKRLEQDSPNVVAYQSGDLWHPFPSLWRSDCFDSLLRHAEDGVRSLQEALNRLGATGIPWPHGSDGPPQANTPEELETLLDHHASIGGRE